MLFDPKKDVWACWAQGTHTQSNLQERDRPMPKWLQ